MLFEEPVKSEKELRKYYEAPIDRSILKVKQELDGPSREFIKNSPFVCLATMDPDCSSDCSPKGDFPGFVKIIDDKLIALPDRKGNNRLDSLVNILKQPKVGLLFFIPGRNETLRLNGRAQIVRDKSLRTELAFEGRLPTVVVLIEIDEVYLHCPKALIRSKLWQRGKKSSDLRTYIQASREQLGQSLSEQEVEQLAQEYKQALKDRLY